MVHCLYTGVVHVQVITHTFGVDTIYSTERHKEHDNNDDDNDH